MCVYLLESALVFELPDLFNLFGNFVCVLKPGTIAQFKVKGDVVYQEEMKTFKKAYVILDMFKGKCNCG